MASIALMALATAAQVAATAAPGDLNSFDLSVSPDPVLIERGETQQLNFDFRVKNGSAASVELRRIELSVVDRRGKLVLRRDADTSGASPAIETVTPDRRFDPGAEGIFFNPFTTFALGFPLDELRFRLTFKPEKGEPFVREAVVRPRAWAPSTKLSLPVAGTAWVKHGHDYLSHHRRWNPLHPVAKSFGATAVFARYALDLLIVDDQHRISPSAPKRNSDFFGWGSPILAPGDGTVVAIQAFDADDDVATGKSGFDPERLPKEPLHFYGNYVIIDHGRGEYSVLGHLQHGSVTVRPGQRVRRGQPVARMGMSGSAEFEPHLHYELRRGTTMAVEGLPAYFADLVRLRGSSQVAVPLGPINSGEFVRSSDPKPRPR